MKSLIVYYSFTQNNELLAQSLQNRLGCDILKIETVKKKSPFGILLDILFNRMPTIHPYPQVDLTVDQFVFVAPIWAGRIASPLMTFLKTERNNIKAYSFISLCGGRNGQKVKIEKELERILLRAPREVMELWVSDLLTPERKKSVTGYKVTEGDLEKYKSEIDEFASRCNSFSAGSRDGKLKASSRH